MQRRDFWIGLPAFAGLQRVLAGDARLKAGCQANGFALRQGDWSGFLSALEEMKRLGYTGCESNVRFIAGEFGRTAGARREIQLTGIQYIGAHTSLEGTNPETFKTTAAGVAAIGGLSIVMSARGLSPAGNFERAALENKAEQLNAMGRICREQGIRLAYHNHNPEFANGNAEIDGLAAATDGTLVDFLIDAGHAYLGGGNPAKFMLEHSGRIFGCHLKTFRNGDVKQQVPLGQGDFDFQRLAAAVKKTNWTGWLITEEGGGPTPGNTGALASDRAYIRKMFGV